MPGKNGPKTTPKAPAKEEASQPVSGSDRRRGAMRSITDMFPGPLGGGGPRLPEVALQVSDDLYESIALGAVETIDDVDNIIRLYADQQTLYGQLDTIELIILRANLMRMITLGKTAESFERMVIAETNRQAMRVPSDPRDAPGPQPVQQQPEPRT